MDKIEIIMDNGLKEDMEIVLEYDYNQSKYIIYKNKKNNYYIAKCDENYNLDTELNNTEIKYGEDILKGAINEITS